MHNDAFAQLGHEKKTGFSKVILKRTEAISKALTLETDILSSEDYVTVSSFLQMLQLLHSMILELSEENFTEL